MGRLGRGWELSAKSWRLLYEHDGLLRLPRIAVAATTPALAAVAVGIYLIDTGDAQTGAIALAGGAYLAVFEVAFFSAALTVLVDGAFAGRRDGLRRGLGAAARRPHAIAAWALPSVALGSLEAMLATPVIAIEGKGPISAVRRSAELARRQWPQRPAVDAVIGGGVLAAGVLPGLLLVVAGAALWALDGNGDDLALGAVLAAVGAVVALLSVLAMQAVKQGFAVALYRFAAADEPVGGFTAAELDSAVRPRA